MLEIRNVSKIYREGDTGITALQDVSFNVEQGDYIAIMGPSGSGKSTLLNIIGGLDRPSSGEIVLDNKRIDNLEEDALVEIRREKIGYVFQQYHLLPSLTAYENVMLPLLFKGADDNEYSRVTDILKTVGLDKRSSHKPAQLSGGEQQRVAIARTVINRPSLILADEPTGNMDQKTGSGILELFHELNNSGLSIIMVTHSNRVAQSAKEIIYLEDGVIRNRTKNDHANRLPV